MNIRRFACAFALPFLSACLSIDPPPPVRTFHTGEASPGTVTAVRASAPAPLRLDRVAASPLLQERMIWQLSDVEIEIDELSRWAVPPATHLEEALRASLFESGAFGENPLATRELAIRLTAFGGDLTGDKPRAHIRFVATLRSRSDAAAVSAVFDESALLSTHDPADLARGMRLALGAATTKLNAWVRADSE